MSLYFALTGEANEGRLMNQLALDHQADHTSG